MSLACLFVGTLTCGLFLVLALILYLVLQVAHLLLLVYRQGIYHLLYTVREVGPKEVYCLNLLHLQVILLICLLQVLECNIELMIDVKTGYEEVAITYFPCFFDFMRNGQDVFRRNGRLLWPECVCICHP